ncbi:GSCOCG00000511001-RA-CDS [Cotesia congregata]|uniref:Uncharacterized protein n=1 Tax=Cotesia congregata TaxID=51543 RepID=A0A8J2H901_COTCN|nr:GSCOCG00000511001-RA-CDS [Cotesia congregata]CAG5087776.1 Protein of unknown function [Cotesia congregata]
MKSSSSFIKFKSLLSLTLSRSLSTSAVIIYGFILINLSRCDVPSVSAGNYTKLPANNQTKLDNHNNATIISNLTLNNSLNSHSSSSSVSDNKHIDKLINSSTLKNKSTAVQNANQTAETVLPSGHGPSLDSGAMMRAFYVFLGLSVIGVAYLIFRSTRLRNSPAQMVRKYGILANKQDIEMRPLPLDEEDDDDNIVFDASGLAKELHLAA